MNQNQFEVVGTFHKSYLDDQYPAFIIKDLNKDLKKFYVTKASKPFAEKLKPEDGVKVTFNFKINEKEFTRVTALKVEELGYVPTAE
jgi:hypothetical protein